MKTRKNKAILTVLLSAVVLMTACNSWSEQEKTIDPTMKQSLMEVMKSMPELSTFVQLLEKTHYDEVLASAQSYTVFAPTNGTWPSTAFDTLAYLKNHIAWQTFTRINGTFTVNKIQMINGKYIPVDGNIIGIEKADVGETVVPAQNGLIYSINRVIEPRMNVWEYMNQKYSNAMPVRLLNAQDEKRMDMEKSYQLYLDANGRPVYDTAWLHVNEWLDRYALDNEDSLYTFVNIPDEVIDRLRAAYRPYFKRCDYDPLTTELVENELLTNNMVDEEITRDLILQVKQLKDGDTVFTMDGVRVRIGSIDEEYQASNGYVYDLMDIDIKIYENKVKTLYVEAENFSGVTSSHGMGDVSRRVKDWASRGFDVMLASSNFFANTSSDNDSKNHYTSLANSGFEYRPILNSVPYRVYMKAFDDTRGSIDASTGDTLNLTYKLLASMPTALPISLSGSGVFSNNFSDTIVFVAENLARNYAEQQFTMWGTDQSTSMYADMKLDAHPDYVVDQLPCNSYGEAVLRLSTSVFSKETATIYLDYIKLVPVVDADK